MLSKMVYGLFIGIIQNYFNGILHLLDINRKARTKLATNHGEYWIWPVLCKTYSLF